MIIMGHHTLVLTLYEKMKKKEAFKAPIIIIKK